MSVHVEKECELPAAGPVRGRESIRRAGRLCLGVAVSTWLAWAAPARAQSGEPSDASTGPAATTAPASAAPDEPPPLADDSAAAATGAADEDAPWNEGVDLDKRRAARAVFLEANTLARKRFFASAAAKYRQALELWPHPAFAYNLALAQLQLDQPIEAHASLERAVAHGPGPLGDRYDQARQQIARIESELGSIEVTCAEPGARVMLDGKLVFTGPGTYRGVVRPGAHQVVAIRRGLSPVVEQPVVSPGEHGRVTLAFEYPETEVIVRKRRWAAWKSYAVVGAGAALVLAGGALDWHSTRLFDAYDRDFLKACPPPDSCELPLGLEERRARAEREQRLAVIGYAAGGTALAAGAVLAWFGRERSHRERVRVAPDSETGPAASAATSSVVPLIAPGVIGVNAGFRF
jgi:tetratricopeptide (TPR) repeat protein